MLEYKHIEKGGVLIGCTALPLGIVCFRSRKGLGVVL